MATAAGFSITPRLRAQNPRARLLEGFRSPPRDAKPHTRWWWPGSAVTPALLTRDLEAMKAGGLGGAEITVVWRFYEKGNIDYLSPAWFEAVRHVLRECQRLDLAAALTFAPGWDFGGPWVAPEDRSKALAPCWQDFQGPFSYEGPLPLFKDFGTPRTGLFEYLSEVEGRPADHDRPLAVIGARLTEENRLDPASLVNLTDDFRGEAGRWRMEEGRWRLMAFRLRYTGQQNASQDLDNPRSFVVDHLSREAMERYLAPIAERFAREFAPWLGSTIESIFSDSFEVVPLANTVLWSNSTPAEFKRRKGYDLTPWLPALWFDAGPDTPRIRYDANEVLHHLALEFCYDPFLAACARLGVKGRMQPHYRFNAELVAGAGRAHQADTEVTTARFETVADPRKATVSGARFAGRPVVSAEAYTFLHRERYRSTLEEMKIASDAFLRDGVTQFWNHGWLFTPEPEVAPTRDFFACERIQPWMPWWPHYKHLAAYLARASWLLRQGRFVADILLYSPQAQAWSEKAVFNVEQRVMKYGGVPRLLLTHGWDYDVVNDELLQHKMRCGGGAAELNGHRYRIIILPDVRVMPVATAQALGSFVEAGGAVLALDRLPAEGAGLHPGDEAALRAAASRFIRIDYGFKTNVFSPQEQPFVPLPPLTPGQRRLLELVRERVAPQFTGPEGVTFQHRQAEGIDLYFVANLRPEPFTGELRFRVTPGRRAELWDPMTGQTRGAGAAPALRMNLEAWESAFILFTGERQPAAKAPRRIRRELELSGPWRLAVEGVRFPRRELEPAPLGSWEDNPALRHFSGEGVYRKEFEAPRRDAVLDLGAVGCTAEAFLNGAPLGVRWMRPYRFEVPSRLVRAGLNLLEVRVRNTLMPHVRGLKEPPDLPADLRPHYGAARPATARQLAGWERDRLYNQPVMSGLAGPVRWRVLA
jgi:hypothetical protein